MLGQHRLIRGVATAVVGAAIALSGCKAGPAKSAGFADSPDMKRDPNVPFHRFWQSPEYSASRYKKVYVAPVNTSYMMSLSDWQKGERKADIEKDVAKLATFTQERFKRAFANDKAHHFEVIDSPAPGSLTIETALIEVVPSKVVLNALGYAPFFIGLGITAVRAVAQDYSSAAFEARIKDSETGQVVMLIADRESEQMAVVSVRGLTWYSHAETIVTQWADQLVQVATRQGKTKVKDTDPFTLMPW